MARIGFLAPPLAGHLDPLRALAGELARRGHEAVLVQQADAAPHWRGPGLRFVAIGAASHPAGSLEAVVARMARPSWIGLRPMLRDVAAASDMVLREAPDALRDAAIDLLVADQAESASGLVGTRLGLPYVSSATALPLDREPGLPPPWLGWSPAADAAGARRIASAWRIVDHLMRPIDDVLARHAHAAGLVPRPAHGWGSPIATLAQAVAGVDFARAAPPPGFAYLGPWRTADPGPSPVSADGARPLAFCSLGSLQGGRAALFERVAAACADLGLHAVIAHGGRLSPSRIARLPGAPSVFGHLPQRAVLARCAVAVSHCGFNTVLDALSLGVPIVALPLVFEQPGTAARLRDAGVAEVVSPPLAATRARIRAALERALGGAHRVRARSIAAEIARAGGVRAAADRIEAVLAGESHPSIRPATGRRDARRDRDALSSAGPR